MEELIWHYFEANLSRYLDILQQMVSINSFTSNPEGVNSLGRLTAKAFSHLGFQSESIQSTNPDFGKHLVMTRTGTSGTVVGLITHLDTVFPPEEENKNQFSWRKEGDRIYGPGTNDIKGGTVMILMVLEALQRYDPEVFNETTWIILCNAAEERWSIDFGDICRERLGVDAIAALVFEAGFLEDKQFSLVAARKGMAIYDIQVQGKSAHAGNNHKTGANAIVQLAHIIQKISDLTNYEQELTFSVGVISGGTVPNRIPHAAEGRGEMRAFSKEVFSEAIDNLMQLNNLTPLRSIDGSFSCDIDIQVLLENAPWPSNPKTDALFKLWGNTGRSLGMEILREERGGLSDGNQIWDMIPTIDGLGPNGRNAHCSERSIDGTKEQEYVTISSFVPKATLNTLAIQSLVTKGLEEQGPF